jgi:5S rRNA maturation endonuclease (ribonuclease M5)
MEQAGTVSKAPARARVKPKPREPIKLPTLEQGTPEELAALARSRGLPNTRGLEALQGKRLLHFATMPDGGDKVRAWLLTDQSRRNAQARRLDGKHWQALDAKPKAKTLKGAEAAWPIGAASIGAAKTVCLVEGMPDALAAATLGAGKPDAWAVVSMIGAALDVHPDALEIFKGKSVYIFVHADEAGEKAARKWAKQLAAAGAKVSGLISDHEGRDLNDALTAGEITKLEI